MTTKVKNNMGAIRSLNTLNKNARAAQKNLRKVSTGERINSAEDDASAYGISEHMREKIRSLDQANQNAQNDMAMMRTAEGAVANIVDTLRTLKQKAIDSANDSNTDEDRRIMQKEVDQLLDQIDDNALVTFNGKGLVNGQMSGISKNIAAIWYCEGLYSPDINEMETFYYDDKPLTQLKDRSGTSLKIDENDIFTVSYVMNGETLTYTEKVGSATLRYVINGSLSPTSPHYMDNYFAYAVGEHVQSSEIRGRYNGMVLTSINDETGDDAQATVIVGNGARAYLDRYGKPAMLPDPSMSSVTINSIRKNYQLSGFNITIRDAGGNIKQNATRALKFKQLQRGEGPSDGNNGVGGFTQAATFHVGAGANQSMTVGLSDMRSKALGLKSADGSQTISIKTRDDALIAIDVFDNAINSALDQLTSIGALEARIEYTIGNITTSTENVQASDSTIRDADMAKEMTNYTRDNILTQAAQAMLAQANQDASSILGLLS